jgi:hypothetical protein
VVVQPSTTPHLSSAGNIRRCERRGCGTVWDTINFHTVKPGIK